MHKTVLVNDYGVELIGKIFSKKEGVESEVQLFLGRVENFPKEPTFVCCWYDALNEELYRHPLSETFFFKYNNSIINTSGITCIKTLVDRVVNSFFTNELKYIYEVKYIKNRSFEK